MYFAFLQKQSVSINLAAERVRITLKEIGMLTYACPNANDLILLDEQLKAIKLAFQEKLTTVVSPSKTGMAMAAPAVLLQPALVCVFECACVCLCVCMWTDLSVAAKFSNTCRYIDDLLTLFKHA